MEMGSFTFLSQQEFSYNNSSFDFFEEMENGFNGNSKKMSRRVSDDSLVNEENNGFKDLLSLLLDEGAKQEQEQHQWLTGFETFFEAEAKIEEINGFEMEEELGNSRKKRARKSGSIAGTSSTVSASSDNTGGGSEHQRRLWVKSRSKDWWEKCNHPDFPDEEFKREFRMSKHTFDMICEELEPAVMKKNTMLRDAIPVRQRVAVCIWRLATGEPLRTVSKQFGLGISTCHKLVLEVCTAIKTVLMPKYIQWPDENKIKQLKHEFESLAGIPNVCGSMYTTHIPISAPKTNVAAYFNKKHTERYQKTSYSITLQGIIDSTGVFTDVCIGWPGSMSDEQVLSNSAFHQRATMGQLKDLWVVGGKMYPLMDWVLVPYTHQNLTWAQHAFNEKIYEIEKLGKEAFGRLKGRWAILQKRMEIKLQELPAVLGACCVLHNICEMKQEEMEGELKFEVFDDEVIAENNLRSMATAQARDSIAHNLLHHGVGGNPGFLL
ncbi:protein ALP1-like [Gossypium arboreum]|uniref:DDE Tnp4 domain-containing protein n=1 Tax=Gossypium arboreum TaxID=29729 RepID=A0ABR0MIV0_GOSAR|nr:protein ALP1-like [Gossypium arboreum]KAK5773204.1 hypothetical protein PVK06_049509 [Gossypium arboreum]